MTREKAAEILKYGKPSFDDSDEERYQYNEAIEMAIDVLQKPSIEIPRNATNGNVMKAIFPDISLADFGDMYNEKWEILHKGRKITKTWWEELYG